MPNGPGGGGGGGGGAMAGSGRSRGTPPQPGAVGLCNLGNTCFINSVIQCLSHTPCLSKFFADGHHEASLNRDNVLGTGGVLAEAFAALIQELWGGEFASLSPERLLSAVVCARSSFGGGGQHDASEFLSFLLDSLHEDVRECMPPAQPARAKRSKRGAKRKKPEAEDRVWEEHMSKNRSVVSQLFQGLLQSTVRCPDCDMASITYDPFLQLSVPIPGGRATGPEEQDTPDPPTRSAKMRSLTVVAVNMSDGRLDSSNGSCTRVPIQVLRTAKMGHVVAEVFKQQGWATLTEGASVKNWALIIRRPSGARGTQRVKEGSAIPASYSLSRIKDGETLWIYRRPRPTFDRKLDAKSKNGPASASIEVIHLTGRWVAAAAGPGPKASRNMCMFASTVSFFAGLDNATPAACVSSVIQSVSPFVTPKQIKALRNELNLYNERVRKEGTVALRDPPLRIWLSDRKHRPMLEVPLVAASAQRHGLSRGLSIDLSYEWFGIMVWWRPDIQKIVWMGADEPEPPGAISPTGTPAAPNSKRSRPQDLQNPGRKPKLRRLQNRGGPSSDKEDHESDNDSDYIPPGGKRSAPAPQPQSVSLPQCIDAYCEKEVLQESEAWFCGACKKPRRATKEIRLSRTPNVLVIHLKRFKQLGRVRAKVSTRVEFPVRGLDLSRWTTAGCAKMADGADKAAGKTAGKATDKPLYDLFAVTNHSGRINSGHYTAFARNLESGTWHSYNDTIVKDVSNDEQLVSSKAYILFYVRRDAFARAGY